jgi:hypothetical protein
LQLTFRRSYYHLTLLSLWYRQRRKRNHKDIIFPFMPWSPQSSLHFRFSCYKVP